MGKKLARQVINYLADRVSRILQVLGIVAGAIGVGYGAFYQNEIAARDGAPAVIFAALIVASFVLQIWSFIAAPPALVLESYAGIMEQVQSAVMLRPISE